MAEQTQVKEIDTNEDVQQHALSAVAQIALQNAVAFQRAMNEVMLNWAKCSCCCKCNKEK